MQNARRGYESLQHSLLAGGYETLPSLRNPQSGSTCCASIALPSETPFFSTANGNVALRYLANGGYYGRKYDIC